ncbi:unnamed protein product, partial [Ectocarpus fasciculatus]
MCLLLFQYGGGTNCPFVLCSNRDEALFRKTIRGTVTSRGDNNYYAPLDEEAGGTWIAFGECNSRFAVVLNYHDRVFAGGKRKSRGFLPLDFINATNNITAREYAAAISGLPCSSYAGFNLIVGDKDGCYYVSNQKTNSAPQHLEPGIVHGISNGAMDDDWCKVTISKHKISAALAGWGTESGIEAARAVTASLMSVMQDDTPLVDPTLGYLSHFWTKSSAIFVEPELDRSGEISKVLTNYGTRTTTIATSYRD